ncbi:MAG: hypothetical protein HOW73_27065 [Polyangiaceae bacterium]|nr:hypothetical protein [Polyangiaceae bacterium]
MTLLRPLVQAQIPVVVATTDPTDTTLRSRHVKDPCLLPGLEEEGSNESLEKLVTLAEKLEHRYGAKPPLVYGSDDSLAFIYRHRDVVERHFAVILNDSDVAESLLYKDTFAELARERGVVIPTALGTGAALDANLRSFTRPVVVKPRSKVFWRELKANLFGPNAKALVFASGRELLSHPAYEQFRGELIVQELIPGDEGQLVSFHGFADERGELLTWFCGRKIRTFPSPTGESSCIELVLDNALREHGMFVARALGLKGPFKIDMIRDAATGRCYTLEVNARFTLWHQLAAADGVNVPHIAYDYLVAGRRPDGVHYEPRHRWMNLYRDYKSFLQRREEGNLGLWAWVRSVASRPAVFESFAWDDPIPALSWFAGMVRAMVDLRLKRFSTASG